MLEILTIVSELSGPAKMSVFIFVAIAITFLVFVAKDINKNIKTKVIERTKKSPYNIEWCIVTIWALVFLSVGLFVWGLV